MLMLSAVHPTQAEAQDILVHDNVRYRVAGSQGVHIDLFGGVLLNRHTATPQVTRYVDIAVGEEWCCVTNFRHSRVRILATDLKGQWPIAAVEDAGGVVVHQFDLDGHSKNGPRHLVGRADLMASRDAHDTTLARGEAAHASTG